jgi:hypothetical protein
VAGGGALIGTGAFTTVEAQRTVNVETTGDASAFLGLAPVNRTDDRGTATNSTAATSSENEYVSDPGDGTIEIDLDGVDNDDADGLNQNARTTFRNLVQVTNNGTQTVETLTLDMIVENADSSTIDSEDYVGSNLTAAVEGAFQFTASDDNNSVTIDEDNDILASGNLDSSLSPGQDINFGLKINLIEDESGIRDLPDADYTLEITAETQNSS